MMSYTRFSPGLPMGPAAPAAVSLMFERPRNRTIRQRMAVPLQAALDGWESDGGSVAATAPARQR